MVGTRVSVREPMVVARKQSGFLHDCIFTLQRLIDRDKFKTMTMTFRITFIP